jgi:uncharacterized membrane protein
MYSAEASIDVPSESQLAWDYVSDYQNFAKFMPNIKEIRMLDNRTSEWRLPGPLGIPVIWKATTTVWDPPQKIAWQSIGGSLETYGFIVIEPLDNGSRITVSVHYIPPGGVLGEAFANLFKDLQKMLEHDLEILGELISGQPVESQNEESNNHKPLS